MDLLAELLARNYPVSFEELTERVPAYRAAPSKEARRRMFERDKDELKAFGVPLVWRIERFDRIQSQVAQQIQARDQHHDR